MSKNTYVEKCNRDDEYLEGSKSTMQICLTFKCLRENIREESERGLICVMTQA